MTTNADDIDNNTKAMTIERISHENIKPKILPEIYKTKTMGRGN